MSLVDLGQCCIRRFVTAPRSTGGRLPAIDQPGDQDRRAQLPGRSFSACVNSAIFPRYS